MFAFVNSSATSTNVKVDSVDSNTYVVVYSWGSDESIFSGTMSHIEQLYSPTTSSCECMKINPLCDILSHTLFGAIFPHQNHSIIVHDINFSLL